MPAPHDLPPGVHRPSQGTSADLDPTEERGDRAADLSPGTLPLLADNRRGFLRSAGGAILGTGLWWTAAANRADAAVGTHTGTGVSGVYDVSAAPYNAKGDGVSDDAPAIQAAINDASLADGYGAGGGEVYLPAGNYLLGAPLTIAQQIILRGAGWGSPYAGQGGTMLIVPATSALLASAALTITAAGRGAVLRDLAILHAQPEPGAGAYTPTAFPAAILVSNTGDVSLENLLLVNPTVGIALVGTAPNNAGRTSLRRIYGQPLTTGLYADFADFTIDDVHFWSFWHDTPSLFTWMETNGVAFDCRRCDNPQFSNIFAQHYYRMFSFSQSPQTGVSSPTVNGTTHGFAIDNADADGGINGIVVDADTVTGTAVDVSQAPCAVLANNVTLQFANLRLSGAPGALLSVSDDQSRNPDPRSRNYVTISNVFCERWNQANNGSAAILSSGASTVYVSGGGVFLQGSGPVYPAANASPNLRYANVNGGILTVGNVAPPSTTAAAPVVASATAAAEQGQPFNFQMTVANFPTSFAASGLPAGLSVNTATGLVGGTPSQAGDFTVVLSAANASGTGRGKLSLTVAAPPVSTPVITSVLTATATANQALTYQITASNAPASYTATGLPAGLNVDPASGLISGTPTTAGTFNVALSATNAAGTGTAVLVLTLAPGLPVVQLLATTPKVTISSGEAGEFTLTMSPAPATDTLINFTIKGSATNGEDYVLLKTTKKIKAGRTSRPIRIHPLGTATGTGAVRTVVLTLQTGASYVVGTSGKVKVKIVDQ